MRKKYFCFIFCGFVFSFFYPSLIFSDTSFEQYCRQTYESTEECPQDICILGCRSGYYQDCFKECFPKECHMINVDKCPLEYCQILQGCNQQENVCYKKMDDENLICGPLAYAGEKWACCPGLVKRCGIELFDGTCDKDGEFSSQSVPICIPCADGICSQFENRCNCPEDCGQPEKDATSL